MNRYLIWGCGGHARSVADVAFDVGLSNIVFVDANARVDESIWGFKVIKPSDLKYNAPIILGVGDNKIRKKAFEQLDEHYKLMSLISNQAYIGKECKIGRGIFIAHNAYIGPCSNIANGAIINTSSIVEHQCSIGKFTHVSIGATIAGNCHVGDSVMIGAGATVIDKINIASNTIIGAGAVVVSNITTPGVYCGVPAKKVK